MLFIRQGATHKVVLGPFVDVGDGFTPETGVALSTADEAEAILHDNGTVVDISGYTWAAITTADGYYHLTLQSGISGTVGHLTIVVNDDSVCLPVRADFTVLEEAVYDKLFAASATGVDADWTDGGRLDLILDAILVDTGTTLDNLVDDLESRLGTPSDLGSGATIAANLVDIEAQTDDIGAAGAGLSAIPWNASWDAEVQSEVNDALVALHLDHLLAADYDPASKPGTSTALLNELVESDSGVSRFTANALERAVQSPLTLTEDYAADGAAGTLAQLLYLTQQAITEFAVSSTTMTVKKLDGSTTAATFTLDDADDPASITRAS